jgi:lysophospholipase L1-like esterase
VKYNAIAEKIMQENEIPIHDLYTFVSPQQDKIMLPANVHFTKDGYDVLAADVVAVIQKTLESK